MITISMKHEITPEMAPPVRPIFFLTCAKPIATAMDPEPVLRTNGAQEQQDPRERTL
jgi:hypothetical protein